MKPQFVAPFGSKAATLRYNALYTDLANSPTWRAIFRQVYGADYPEEVMPLSYITLTTLQRIAHELAVVPGGTIVDLGCGGGGPGLWVARETGAILVGIDLSSAGVDHASRRAKDTVGRALSPV